MGLEPGATGWKAQTNPLSYKYSLLVCVCVCVCVRERERERAKREDCKISFTDSFTVAPKSPKLGIAEDGSTFLTLCSF